MNFEQETAPLPKNENVRVFAGYAQRTIDSIEENLNSIKDQEKLLKSLKNPEEIADIQAQIQAAKETVSQSLADLDGYLEEAGVVEEIERQVGIALANLDQEKAEFFQGSNRPSYFNADDLSEGTRNFNVRSSRLHRYLEYLATRTD